MRQYIQYVLAHHPLCDNYRSHVYIIAGRKICRGCLCQYTGVIAGMIIPFIVILLDWWTGMTDIQIGVILYILITPSVFTGLLDTEKRKFKDVARFLLGVAFTWSFILLIVTSNNIVRLWILVNFIPGAIFFSYLRGRRNEKTCQQCTEISDRPYCSGLGDYSRALDVIYPENKQEMIIITSSLEMREIKE